MKPPYTPTSPSKGVPEGPSVDLSEKPFSFGESERIEEMFENAELLREKKKEKEKEKEKGKGKGKEREVEGKGKEKEKDEEKGKGKEREGSVKGGTKRKRWEVEQAKRDEVRNLKGMGVSAMKTGNREVRSDGEHECDNCREHFLTIKENTVYVPLHSTDHCPLKKHKQFKHSALTPPLAKDKWKESVPVSF